MRLVRIGAANVNQTPLDWDGNRRNIVSAIGEARRLGVSILCLPELCVTGYGCEDAFFSRSVQETALSQLVEILPETAGIIVSVGLPILYNNALFNAACLIADGRIRGFVAKRYLAGDGIHYEPRWFKPWPEETQVTVSVAGAEYPLGDLYFDCGGIKIGFEICEDAWVAKRPGSALSLKGVDLILNPSASHFAFGKYEVRKRFVLEGSRAFGVSYVYSNLVGNESGRVIFDGGNLIASSGKLIAAGPRFTYEDRLVTSAIVDIDATRTAQARTGSFRPDMDEDTSDRVSFPFTYPELLPERRSPAAKSWEAGEWVKEEEFARAVALGLFDYLRKTRCAGFVVSLSGGADSSACACLVAAMVHLGSGELGMKRFLDKLPASYPVAKPVEDPSGSGPAAPVHGPVVEQEPTAAEVMRELLVCIYQATRNSSAVTRQAAEEVARSIGASFMALEIDSLVDGYVHTVEGALGRSLEWSTDDIALQNIQARVRSPGAWLVANVRNALLLVTSNRSEAAVGYATMDGDTSGALSPIGGIDKAFLRHWNSWLEREGIESGPQSASGGASGRFKVAALSYVNAQQPTAELRPAAAAQTDEKDLMPYTILDEIERAAILDRHGPQEIFLRLRAAHPEYSAAETLLWVERFFTLWCRNQWKRERYAPSFHLDDESLDPKTWCRFPILSGGYTKELRELKALVEGMRGAEKG